MKKTVVSILCIGFILCVSCTDRTPAPQPTIESLYEIVDKDLGISERAERLPNSPYNRVMRAIFFKIHDDIPRVLVTGGEWLSNDGHHGWDYYRFINGQWQKGPERIVYGTITSTGEPNCHIDAGFDDFYILTEEGQKPKFVVIDSHSDRDGEIRDGNAVVFYNAWRVAHHITLDAEGYLITIPMPEFTIEKFKFDEDAWEENAKRFEIKLKSPNDKLERVEVQTFNPNDHTPKK